MSTTPPSPTSVPAEAPRRAALRSLDEALAALLADLAPVCAAAPEVLPTADALGRVLAADVVSLLDVPPADNTSMDGYAMRVPTPTGSATDLSLNMGKAASKEEINAAMKAAAEGPMAGILRYTWLNTEEAVTAAKAGIAAGASRVCLVASGTGPSNREVGSNSSSRVTLQALSDREWNSQRPCRRLNGPSRSFISMLCGRCKVFSVMNQVRNEPSPRSSRATSRSSPCSRISALSHQRNRPG